MKDLIIILIFSIFILLFFKIMIWYQSKDFVYNRHLFWCKLANNLGIALIASSIVGSIITKNWIYILLGIIGIYLILIDVNYNPKYLSEKQCQELDIIRFGLKKKIRKKKK